jgi:phosphoglycolate phosphatase
LLALLFDLDGTLTDPRPGIVRCMKHALDKVGALCPSDDVLASFIGPPLRETFATLLETSDRNLIERVLAIRKMYADRIVHHLGLDRYFAGVYGPELEGRLATERISAERAVMVGDRAGDIVAARANRVRSIGVLWGYGSESELADACADGLCASPSDLASCLSRIAI